MREEVSPAVPQSREELIGILEQMLDGIRNGDSLEGSLSWTLPVPNSMDPVERKAVEDRDFMVRARYRTGDSMGQGGTIILQRRTDV